MDIENIDVKQHMYLLMRDNIELRFLLLSQLYHLCAFYEISNNLYYIILYRFDYKCSFILCDL